MSSPVFVIVQTTRLLAAEKVILCYPCRFLFLAPATENASRSAPCPLSDMQTIQRFSVFAVRAFFVSLPGRYQAAPTRPSNQLSLEFETASHGSLGSCHHVSRFHEQRRLVVDKACQACSSFPLFSTVIPATHGGPHVMSRFHRPLPEQNEHDITARRRRIYSCARALNSVPNMAIILHLH